MERREVVLAAIKDAAMPMTAAQILAATGGNHCTLDNDLDYLARQGLVLLDVVKRVRYYRPAGYLPALALVYPVTLPPTSGVHRVREPRHHTPPREVHATPWRGYRASCV
jgi:DNA-binding transcriptional ArsR family regulator